jgi:hypothetical protein
MNDTPESIALILLEKILEREDPLQKRNEPPAARLLDLYAECLMATNGDRLIPKHAATGWLN